MRRSLVPYHALILMVQIKKCILSLNFNRKKKLRKLMLLSIPPAHNVKRNCFDLVTSDSRSNWENPLWSRENYHIHVFFGLLNRNPRLVCLHYMRVKVISRLNWGKTVSVEKTTIPICFWVAKSKFEGHLTPSRQGQGHFKVEL